MDNASLEQHGEGFSMPDGRGNGLSFTVTARASCADSVQMEIYKKWIPDTSDAPPPPQQGVAQSRLLTARLNLLTMNILQQVSGIQTVEQELSTYLTTEVAAGTDPLAFWHVSNSCCSFPWLTVYTSC